MAQPTNPPSLDAWFLWNGAVRYANPEKENHQRSFFTLLSCLSKWVGQTDVAHFLTSSSNFWTVRDLAVGCRSLSQLAAERVEKGHVTSEHCANALTDLAAGVSSIAILTSGFFDSGILQGFAIEPIKFVGGVLGIGAFAKRSYDAWNELQQTPKGDDLLLRKNRCIFAMKISVLAIKTIGVIAITCASSRVRLFQIIITQKQRLLLGLLTVITSSSVVKHFTGEYIDLLKRGA